MKLGFTGTQRGATNYQLEFCEKFLGRRLADAERAEPNIRHEFHHGDCVGADSEVAKIARALGYYLVAHPPVNNEKRAFVKSDLVLAPLPYLARNSVIVDDTDELLACPKESQDALRSGTWTTIRYAQLQKRKVTVVPPLGSGLLF